MSELSFYHKERASLVQIAVGMRASPFINFFRFLRSFAE